MIDSKEPKIDSRTPDVHLPEQFDVIVVGGGPAGSTAARRAAQKGASVLLIDAATFPRVKPCGGAVSEQALSYLDFPLEAPIIQAEVCGARIHYAGNIVEGRRKHRMAVLTSRIELDAFLLKMAADAGVNIVQGERVEEVSQTDSCVVVSTAQRKFTSKYLIGADGAQGVISRTIRPKLSKDEFAVAYEGDVACTALSPALLSHDLIDIYFGQEYMGYSWIFPKRDRWNIGVGALASQATNVKSQTRNFLANLTDLRIDNGASLESGRGWTIPTGGYRRIVGLKRIYLVGDAAGFVDPFTGEGIAYAILSGSQAGEITGAASLESAGTSVETSQKRYLAFCRSHIDADLKYGLLFAKLLHFWPNGLLRLFSTDSRLIDKYLEVPAATMSYREYFRWFLPRALVGILRMVSRDLRTAIIRRPTDSQRNWMS
jgi:geranylgeranyl reductase family protein